VAADSRLVAEVAALGRKLVVTEQGRAEVAERKRLSLQVWEQDNMTRLDTLNLYALDSHLEIRSFRKS
jgi:hypothetical protein